MLLFWRTESFNLKLMMSVFYTETHRSHFGRIQQVSQVAKDCQELLITVFYRSQSWIYCTRHAFSVAHAASNLDNRLSDADEVSCCGNSKCFSEHIRFLRAKACVVLKGVLLCEWRIIFLFFFCQLPVALLFKQSIQSKLWVSCGSVVELIVFNWKARIPAVHMLKCPSARNVIRKWAQWLIHCWVKGIS